MTIKSINDEIRKVEKIENWEHDEFLVEIHTCLKELVKKKYGGSSE